MHSSRNRAAQAVALLTLALAAAGAGASGAEPQAGAGGPVDGIRCDRAEGAVLHVHQHLSVLERGVPRPIPSDVGRPLFAPCLYWVHTHTSDGIIHVESPVFRTFTLGNFFDIWGEPLSAERVGSLRLARGRLRVYVNGSRYRGDPRKIELTEHSDIALEAGPPYQVPAPFRAWAGQ